MPMQLTNLTSLPSEDEGSSIRILKRDRFNAQQNTGFLIFIDIRTVFTYNINEHCSEGVLPMPGKGINRELIIRAAMDMIESDGLTEELREAIVGQVEDLLKDPEMTKADRQAMEEKIISIVGQEIVPVCSAKISEVFEGWAEEAINLIKK